MEAQERSSRGSSRSSSRTSGSSSSGSSSGSSPGSSPDPDVKVPHWRDNQAMLLWRATVDPLHNIGAPISAEWEYYDDVPNTADENRSSIRQPVDRAMVLYYKNPGSLFPGIGDWIPGEKFETVSFPKNSGKFSGFPDYYVEHSTSIPLGKGYNSQYIEPKYYPPDSAAELDEEDLHNITLDLYGKGKKYIKNYVKRYFVTPNISDEFTEEDGKQARKIIADIFIRANSKSPDEVDFNFFVEDQWYGKIKIGHLFKFIFFDKNLFQDDVDVKMYNKKGKTLRPANKAELRRGLYEGTQYVPRFNPSPTSPSRRMRRRRTQRKRDKKIMKEYRAFLESTKDNPDAIYDGGRRYRKKQSTRKK